jgi:peptidoglycan-N-acetylglucosamine deacetylase
MPHHDGYTARMVELLSLQRESGLCLLEVGINLDGEQIRCRMDIGEDMYKELSALQVTGGGRIRLSTYTGWDPYRKVHFGTLSRMAGDYAETLYFPCPENFGSQLMHIVQDAAALMSNRSAAAPVGNGHKDRQGQQQREARREASGEIQRQGQGQDPEQPQAAVTGFQPVTSQASYRPPLIRRRLLAAIRTALVAAIAVIYFFRSEGTLFTENADAFRVGVMAPVPDGKAETGPISAGYTADEGEPGPVTATAVSLKVEVQDGRSQAAEPLVSSLPASTSPDPTITPEPAPTPAPEKLVESIEIGGDKSFFKVPDGVAALSFDDGPSVYTKKIVDMLVGEQVAASFLFVGKNAEHYPESVTYAYEHGMSVGNHSWEHGKLTDFSAAAQKEDLARTNRTLEKLTGNPVTLFRPPYGAIDSGLTKSAKELKLKVLLWNRDAEDWNAKSPEDILRYFHTVDPSGGVYVLHEDKQTVEALPDIIHLLKEKGLKFAVFK